MKFICINWNNWDAIKCVTEKYELIVGVSAGPRILSIKYEGGENLLYQDINDFKVDEWRIYGGHRFTLGPENSFSYYPDNDPCDVRIVDNKLIVKAPERPNGILLSIEICEMDEGGFLLDHILENNGDEAWQGALWAITCVPRSSDIRAHCEASKLNFWRRTDPSMWHQNNKYLSIKKGHFRGKVGWHSQLPELSALQQTGSIVIQSSDSSFPSECIDDGSNVEIFVCPDFIELETLSKNTLILPRGSAHHLQQWQVLPPERSFKQNC